MTPSRAGTTPSSGQGVFRPPLDISKYVEAVGGAAVLQGGPRVIPAAEREQQRRDAEEYAERLARTPQKMGVGPADCSTCTDLTTLVDSSVVWDVNGYYRALGITPPYRGITKRSLREAYLAVDGPNDPYLTRVFKFLLDADLRREYDRAPLGERHLDEIQHELITLQAVREASTRAQRGVKSSKDDVLDEWGLKFIPDSDELPEPDLDSVGAVGHSADEPTEEHWRKWPWGYFLWGSKRFDETAELAQWQALLVREFSARQARMRFSVGFHGSRHSPSDWVTAVSGPHLVIFLNEDAEPTDENAAAAVAYVLREHTDETARKAQSMSSGPNFGRGGASAKERAKALNARAKTRFLSLDDGESVILRFIDDSDDWIQTMQHSFVPTKAAPSDLTDDQKKKWPKHMGAVCRHDDAFAEMYTDCYICDEMWDEEKDKPHKPSLRLWARAVVRTPVIGTEEMAAEGKIPEAKVGKRLGLKDSEVDEPELDAKGEATGKTVRVKEVVLVNMGMKNFFGALQGAYEIFGTVLDRDFSVTRDGKGTATDYNIVALPEIKNAEGEVYTLQDPEIRARYTEQIDLVKYVTEQASDEKYARYFDPTKKVESRKKDSDGGKSNGRARRQESDDEVDEAPKTAQKSGVDRAALDAMKARVRGAKKPEPEPDEDTADAEETSAPMNFDE